MLAIKLQAKVNQSMPTARIGLGSGFPVHKTVSSEFSIRFCIVDIFYSRLLKIILYNLVSDIERQQTFLYEGCSKGSYQQMDEKCYAKEVKEQIESNDITLGGGDESLNLECESSEHDEDVNIREGNRIFSILVKQEDEWNVESLTCRQCSVRDVLEKASDEGTVAVVESRLRADEDCNAFYFENPEVWELMLAN